MKNLKDFREQIDEIDDELFSLLNKRMMLSKEIGQFKKGNKIEVKDSSREEEIKQKFIKKVKPEFKEEALKILDQILSSSKKIQL